MAKGQRVIEGRVYSLGGRAVGLNAKRIAQSEAAAKRATGKLVRIIKLSELDFLIYEFG